MTVINLENGRVMVELTEGGDGWWEDVEGRVGL